MKGIRSLFGLSLVKSRDYKILKDKIEKWDNRPSRGMDDIGTAEEGLLPLMFFSFFDIEVIFQYSDTLQTIITALTREIFRNWGEFKEKFVKKCEACGKEYDSDIDKCETKGCNGILRDPNAAQLDIVRELFEGGWVNLNKQDLSDISEELNNDLEKFDICYLMFNKEYIWTGKKVYESKIKELIRADPRVMRLVADKKGRLGYDENGNKVYTCLKHRNQLFRHPQKTCTMCGSELYQAHYVDIGMDGTQKTYYVEGEIFHTTKYKKSLTYGWPKVLSCYQKVMTLFHMDRMMLDWYRGRRPPRGLLLVAIKAWSSFTKAWEWLLKKVKKNPGQIWPLGIETTSAKGGKLAEFINFMNTMEEMQYIQAREEMRKTIGGLWGVMPVYQADVSASGGLNNEGMQITVTTRAALYGQKIFNNKIFKEILRQYGVTDWEFILNSPEEKDEMAEKQRNYLDVQTASLMRNMGFDVKYNENGDFEYSGEASEPIQIPFGSQFQSSKPKIVDETAHNQGQPEKFTKSTKKKDDEAYTTQELLEFIQEQVEDVEKEVQANVIYKADDLNDFLRRTIFDLTFKSMTKKQSDTIKNYLISKIGEKISMSSIIEKIMKVGKVDRNQAERITRTEFINVLQNKSREYSYKKLDPKGEYKFVWMGPKDHRTTKICEAISARTKKGVSMEELKKIIKKFADPEIYDPSRPWTPHINCRHRMLRKV